MQSKHNQKVQNIVLEKKTLTAQVWRYILNELEGDLNQYDQKKIQLELQIQGLQNSRRDKQQKIHNLQTEVKELNIYSADERYDKRLTSNLWLYLFPYRRCR